LRVSYKKSEYFAEFVGIIVGHKEHTGNKGGDAMQEGGRPKGSRQLAGMRLPALLILSMGGPALSINTCADDRVKVAP